MSSLVFAVLHAALCGLLVIAYLDLSSSALLGVAVFNGLLVFVHLAVAVGGRR